MARRETELAELSERMTSINKAIRLKEHELSSLKYQYEKVAEQYWTIEHQQRTVKEEV